jgi:hypothetical protein
MKGGQSWSTADPARVAFDPSFTGSTPDRVIARWQRFPPFFTRILESGFFDSSMAAGQLLTVLLANGLLINKISQFDFRRGEVFRHGEIV